MSVPNRIDDSFSNCKVLEYGIWKNGKYKYHKPDGVAVVEVCTGWGKTHRKFKPDALILNEGTEVIQK